MADDSPTPPPPPAPPLWAAVPLPDYPAIPAATPSAVAEDEPAAPVPPPPTAVESLPSKPQETSVLVVESDDSKPADPKKLPESLASFKEESNRVSDLSAHENKALEELKQLVQEGIRAGQFGTPPPPQAAEASPTEEGGSKESEGQRTTIQNMLSESKETVAVGSQSHPQDVSIWGIPLLKDDRSDVILLKFLRARDFKPKDSFVMIKNTLRWRREFRVDDLVDEDLGDDLDKAVFMQGHDREGHPVCYNVYGEFQNKELYQKTFSDAAKRARFLRWRIQFLERSIRKLDFSPGGVSTIFQVSDLKNSPGPAKGELRLATKQALLVLQDNYPEFVAKQVFINVPWWYLAFYTVINPFLTHRTKSKFVFAAPSKSAETLFKYISPEQVPIQYGGLCVDPCDCNPEFSLDDPVTDIAVKPATKQTVEIIVSEKCTVIWELRVVGWEVNYGAEFVPQAIDGYTILIHKMTKVAPTDEPVVSGSYKIDELGKIVLTVANPTSKKKKLLYRYKVLSSSS